MSINNISMQAIHMSHCNNSETACFASAALREIVCFVLTSVTYDMITDDAQAFPECLLGK